MPEPYPNRPPDFFTRFVRELFDQGTGNAIGPVACLLAVAVASEEAGRRFRGPVRLHDAQLMLMVGIGSKAMAKARDQAVADGWLVYEPEAQGKVGRYFVAIPGGLPDDGPVWGAGRPAGGN